MNVSFYKLFIIFHSFCRNLTIEPRLENSPAFTILANQPKIYVKLSNVKDHQISLWKMSLYCHKKSNICKSKEVLSCLSQTIACAEFRNEIGMWIWNNIIYHAFNFRALLHIYIFSLGLKWYFLWQNIDMSLHIKDRKQQ